jgi:GAF domain-containing protein
VSGVEPGLRGALAAGVLASEAAHRDLLDSVVQAARAIFGARAASIMLYEEAAGELVFEAIAGEGAARLLGTRFPATQGIAGWVLASGQPAVIEDVASDPRFRRDVAERSGYVPKGLMAAPLEGREGPLGVIQVLDRPQRARFSVHEMELLDLFAAQAAVALEIVRAARQARELLVGLHEPGGGLARVVAALEGLDGPRRARAEALLAALADVIDDTREPPRAHPP